MDGFPVLEGLVLGVLTQLSPRCGSHVQGPRRPLAATRRTAGQTPAGSLPSLPKWCYTFSSSYPDTHNTFIYLICPMHTPPAFSVPLIREQNHKNQHCTQTLAKENVCLSPFRRIYSIFTSRAACLYQQPTKVIGCYLKKQRLKLGLIKIRSEN